MKQKTPFINKESGNVFVALFTAIALVGAVGTAATALLRGPMSTMTEMSARNTVEAELMSNARILIMETINQAESGDCDDDGAIEPYPFQIASGRAPTGGGALPAEISAVNATDPWNTEYGYCVWDHGSSVGEEGCGVVVGGGGYTEDSPPGCADDPGIPGCVLLPDEVAQNRLEGYSTFTDLTTIAVMSAGKDRTFQTTCQSFDDADVDNNNTLGDPGDGLLLTKVGGSDDYVIAFTYAEAAKATTSLWNLDVADVDEIEIEKDVEVTGGAALGGNLDLTSGGLVLPDENNSGLCNSANDLQLRLNGSTSPATLEICDFSNGSDWTGISGGSGSGDDESGGEGYAWGDDTDGQLGNGDTTTTDQNAPVEMGFSQTLVAVDAGTGHVCGVTSAGDGYCWGSDDVGELGNGGTTGDQASPSALDDGSSSWIQISAGEDHSCGVTNAGVGYCWGEGDNGRLGNGGTTDATSPSAVSGGLTFKHISAGFTHSCGVTTDGDGYCWGTDDVGELGNGTGTTGDQDEPSLVSNGITWQQIHAGKDETCGLATSGTVYCWGSDYIKPSQDTTVPESYDNNYNTLSVWEGGCGVNTSNAIECWGEGSSGENGDGTNFDSYLSASTISSALTWRSVSRGDGTVCGVTTGSEVYCWGLGTDGQIGNSASISVNTPTAVSGSLEISDVSVGGVNVTAITRSTSDASLNGVSADGSVFVWGINNYGQLALGNDGTNKAAPAEAVSIQDMVYISRGVGTHGCGIDAGGNGYCWGRGHLGQIGNGGTNDAYSTPQLISGNHKWSMISMGQDHTCGVTVTGDGYCWGKNDDTQLGAGVSGEQSTPQLVQGGYKWNEIQTGSFHTCGLTTSNEAYCWGDDDDGQLGNGAVSGDQAAPYAVTTTGLVFTQLSVGNYTNCALTAEGAAYCWGRGTSGQLGNSATSSATQPAAVSGGIAFETISTSFIHVCGLATTGITYCWGDGTRGRLGIDDTSDYDTPQPLDDEYSFVDVKTVIAGGCGLRGDGRIQCWGRGTQGAVGDNQFTDSNIPVYITSNEFFVGLSTIQEAVFGLTGDNEAETDYARGPGIVETFAATQQVIQPGTAGNTMSSHGIGIQLDSIERGESAGIAFNVASSLNSDIPTASIMGVRHGPNDAGGLAFKTRQDASTFNFSAYFDSDGDLGLNVGGPIDVLAALQINPHQFSDWSTTYARGLLINNTSGTSEMMYFGHEGDSDADAALVFSGDQFLFQNTNQTASSITTLLTLEKDGTATFENPVSMSGDTAYAGTTSYSSTASDKGAYNFNRYEGSEGAETVLSGGAIIGDVTFDAYDGTSLDDDGYATIYAQVMDDASSGNVPADLVFGLSSSGNIMASSYGSGRSTFFGMPIEDPDGYVESDVARLTYDGKFSLGIDSPDEVMDVGGGANFDAGFNIAGSGPCENLGDFARMTYNATTKNIQMCDGEGRMIPVADSYNDNGGIIYTWGSEQYGKLGNGATGGTQDEPVQVTAFSEFIKIEGGPSNSCAIASTGEAYCWGRDDYGQVGDGPDVTGDHVYPTKVSLYDDFIDISIYTIHACGVRSNGKAYCWGNDGSGRLGNGSTLTAYQDVPSPVDTDYSDFVDIATGVSHTCAVRSNGEVYCWGTDANGQLGNGTTTTGNQDSPVKVNTIDDAVQICLARNYSCVLLEDGSIKCWGMNDRGQLGIGNKVDTDEPGTAISGPYSQVDCGYANVCGLQTDGGVDCWGADGSLQLGNGATTGDQTTPDDVENLTDVVDIGVGSLTGCAITASNETYCWGNGSSGEIGNGASSNVNTPTLVNGGHVFKDIEVGGPNVIALTKDLDANKPFVECDPLPLEFEDQYNVPTSSIITTNTIVVSGIELGSCTFMASSESSALTIVHNGGDESEEYVSVENGDTLALKITSSGSADTAFQTSVRLGTQTDLIIIDTGAP